MTSSADATPGEASKTSRACSKSTSRTPHARCNRDRQQMTPSTRASPHDLFRVCRDTERTAHLTRLAGYLVRMGLETSAATDLCLAWNAHNDPPLPDAKIRFTVVSIARTHARNHPGYETDDTPLFDLAEASVGRFIGKPVPERDWDLEECLPRGKVGMLVAPGAPANRSYYFNSATRSPPASTDIRRGSPAGRVRCSSSAPRTRKMSSIADSTVWSLWMRSVPTPCRYSTI